MESRMERYAKYRESIKRMSSEEFATAHLSPEEKERAKRAVTPEAAAEFVHAQLSREPDKYDVNADYLRAKKRLLIAQIIVGVLLLAAFVVWGVFLMRRFA